VFLVGSLSAVPRRSPVNVGASSTNGWLDARHSVHGPTAASLIPTGLPGSIVERWVLDNEERRIRMTFHEAGHAVLHFALGRPIVYVVARSDHHRTKAVDGTVLDPHLESILWVSGLSAEREWLRSVGRGDEAIGWFAKSGALGDYSALEALYNDEQVGDAESEADQLVTRYWPAIGAVAELLQQNIRLGQDDIAALAERHRIDFGEASADFAAQRAPEG
jgi:hypothetical protein